MGPYVATELEGNGGPYLSLTVGRIVDPLLTIIMGMF
jgi:hypothetical protein